MSLNLYLGQLPEHPQARRILRERALSLVTNFQRPALDPTTMLLNIAFDGVALDLLVVRPHALLVGNLYSGVEPITVQPDGTWRERNREQPLRGPHGETPLELLRQGRAALVRRLEQAALLGLLHGTPRLERTIGALLFAPNVHPETRIALDIDDHRQQLKLVGLDELAALAAMVNTGVQIDESAARSLVSEVLGGRPWYADEQWLFELARAPFQLRVLADNAADELVLSLLEGSNVVGRRRTLLQDEYRLTLADDDLMSNSHAIITCATEGRVLLRDTSTNGTWFTLPDSSAAHLHHAERVISPGTLLRMGATQVRLERAEDMK